MSKPVLLSGGNGKVQELVGTANNDVLTWDSTLDGGSWKSAAGGVGSGTVTSVGLTGGTSGIQVSVGAGESNPITTAGTFNLDAPLRFAFNTATPTEVAAAGQVSYNADEGSLEQMFDGGHVKSVLGQTLHQRVLNETGSTLTKGQVVYVSGAQGNRVTVALAQANADSTSATIIGLVAYAIADAAEGYVITEGLIKGVDTSGFTEGLPVYLSPTTPGALTQTKPTAPQHLVLVGYCVRVDATVGEILVKTQNGYEIEELHDVYVNNPQSGQLLIYDATAGQTRWENASLTAGTGVTVTPGAGALTVAIGQAVGTGDSPTFVQVTTTERVVTDALRARTTVGSGLSLLKIDPVLGDAGVIVQPTAATTAVAAYFAGGSLSGTSPGTAAAGYFTGGGGGSGTGNGGDAYVRGGGVSGSGLVGRVYVGDSNTRSVTIGATGVTTTINGTFSLTNDLAVTEGGTGASSFTQYGVLVGNGASAIQATAVGTTNQYLKSGAGSANPAFATIAVGEVTGAAPLASPTFTGTPSLPTGTTGVTQSAGNNSTALATTAFVTTAVATSSGAPYDLPCEIPGTPDVSKRVVNFEAVRPFILATTGHQGGQVTAPSGNFTCTVKKNATTLGTITFGTSSFSTSITGTLAERTFAAGDVLIVETPAASLGIDTPFWTFFMTLA